MQAKNATGKRKTDRKKLLTMVLTALAVFLVLYAILDFVPDLLDVLRSGDEQTVEAFIRSSGPRGMLLLVVLQTIQTVTVFFPGVPIYMCAGFVFGKLKGTVLCYLTYVVVNTAVFIFARKMHLSADGLLKGKALSRQLQFRSRLQKSGNAGLYIVGLCIFPVIPNGLVPYFAAQTRIRIRGFVAAVAVGCLPGIFLFVSCGDLIITKNYKPLLIFVLAVAVCGACAWRFRDKIVRFFPTA